jgi:hypothetical protein
VAHASSITHARANSVARLRAPAARAAQLLAISGFALAQPLFDILGKNAEFFAVRGSTPSDIVLFALVVTFVPALALFAVELAVGVASTRAADVAHYVFVACLGAIFGIQLLKHRDLVMTWKLVTGAIVIGVALAVAVWRTSIGRSFLTILAAAPLVFLATFLFNSKVEKLVFPKEVGVAAAAGVDASTPVVVLQLDEFPVIDLLTADGAIDAKRFPNFAKLAGTSTWFRNTTTWSALTTVAVPVILTGNAPRPGTLPVVQNYPDNLFTLLGSRYRMQVVESQTRLCPPRLCKRKVQNAEHRLSSLYSDARVVYLHLIAPPRLETHLPTIDESWGNFGQDAGEDLESTATAAPKTNIHTFYIGRVKDFNGWLATFRAPAPQPTLYWMHFLMPHGPWLYFPNGRVSAVTATRAPGRTKELWWNSDLAVQAWQRHLLQTGYLDKLLGRFIARLKAVGLWDKALVVVNPDHGISFRGGDRRRDATKTNLSDLAFIPFFVKLPGQKAGRIVDTHVTTEDVLPTIAGVLGIDVPWHTDGHSALDEQDGPDYVQVGKVRMPYQAALAQRQQSLRRELSLFGSGDWGAKLFATGPWWPLVGRRVDTLSTSRGSGRATIDAVGSKLLRALPKHSPLVPSPLAGTLAGVEDNQPLAVAVNGRIAGVTRSYTELGGGLKFSALVPDDAFRAGANEVRLFMLSGSAASPVLQELRVTLS